MKRKIKGSIKLRIWEYFCLFAVALLVFCWLLLIVFIKYFYIGAMTRETLNNSREIVSIYRKGELDGAILSEIAQTNNLTVVITDERGFVKGAFDQMGALDGERIDLLKQYTRFFGDIHTAIINDSNNEIYHRIEFEDSDRSILFYAAKSVDSEQGEGAYIYVVSQLYPIESVVNVIQKQFVLITFIVMFIASLVAYVFARRFSHPIEKLTASAKELAHGNSDVDFTCDDAFGEINELSDALKYAADEINKSDQFRKELIANVSHDLRTPLTMIKMYAEMIRDISGDVKEKREKNINIIIDETDRLSNLVNDLLRLSEAEYHSEAVSNGAFNISETTTRILEKFSILTVDGYSFDLEAPEQVYVLGDEARIEQVLYNLISNAVNYTGDDQKVFVRITKKYDTAKIEIIDTGNGIPKEELANIWNRYYRSKTHIRSKVGSGLGLSIVKTILKAHNADFGIESTVGAGSNFWFELKLPENSYNKTLRLADNNIVSDE